MNWKNGVVKTVNEAKCSVMSTYHAKNKSTLKKVVPKHKGPGLGEIHWGTVLKMSPSKSYLWWD